MEGWGDSNPLRAHECSFIATPIRVSEVGFEPTLSFVPGRKSTEIDSRPCLDLIIGNIR